MSGNIIDAQYRSSKNFVSKLVYGFMLLFATGTAVNNATKKQKASLAFYLVIFLVALFFCLFFVWFLVTVFLMSGI